jgi:hypothetical protein
MKAGWKAELSSKRGSGEKAAWFRFVQDAFAALATSMNESLQLAKSTESTRGCE